VVAGSEQTRRDLLELLELDPDRIEVISPGLDAEFRPRPEEREGARRRLGLGGPILLHVGHTGFYKNIEGCLRILARLRHQGIDARLVRVGEPLRPAQRALMERLGLGSFVREAGRATVEELAQLYIAADVLLFPSLYEGFGWPPLEAMACGLPVVCSNAGSLPEVAGEAALMTAAEDEEGLTRCVAEVLAQPAVAAGMRARGVRAAARYSWDVAAARVAGVYERVLERA
jgi:glycosyltransferase involved in cell wall biosynthesis